MKVGVIDYGAGNLQSVARTLRSIEAEPCVVSSASDYERRSFSHLIFPGVGRASQAMEALRARGLEAVIRQHVASGLPLLGICVGMQVLGRFSAEDDTPCLGLLDFELKRLECSEPVPHMGWNLVHFCPGHPLVSQGPFAGFRSDDPFRRSAENGAEARLTDQGGAHFYFVHSFAAVLVGARGAVHGAAPDTVVAMTEYGSVSFASVVGTGHVLGVQFHVEKSGRAGQQFLRDFLKMEPSC